MNPNVQPEGPFSDHEALDLLLQYREDPASLRCPSPECSYVKNTIEILAFIQPEIDAEGFASVKEPEGEYAAAIYCHNCHKAVGILASHPTSETDRSEENRIRHRKGR